MKPKHIYKFLLLLLITSVCFSCIDQKKNSLVEQPLTEIPLKGLVTKKKSELSGLTWLGDTLILLPQYPEKFGKPGVLFTIPKKSIIDFLDGKSTDPITPGTIYLFMPNLEEAINGFEGFESIVINSDIVYLTIESGKGSYMMGYIISGKISLDSTEIRLDSSKIVSIPPAVQLDNRTDEALIYYKNRLYTFFEANGKNITPHPVAHIFDLNLNSLETISFPQLEYRVTDAAIGSNNEIWIINQASSKDIDILPLYSSETAAPTSGTETNNLNQSTRLVKLEFTNNGFVLSESPPIQIKPSDTYHNWEGLAVLDDRGFLLVTDKSPDTILGFIKKP